MEISYASQDEISKLEHVADPFFPAILEIAYEDCIITDDFHGDNTNDEYHRRILERYGVDVSDVQSGNLVEIFKRLDGKFPAGARCEAVAPGASPAAEPPASSSA